MSRRMSQQLRSISVLGGGVLASAVVCGAVAAQEPGGNGCDAIFNAISAVGGANLHAKLSNALIPAPVGLQNDMWGTIVDVNGIVCAVAHTGTSSTGSQWLASRVISAQKSNTANSLSLTAGSGGLVPGLALSTANLWAATQPGGSLFGLQFSNPVDPAVAYGDNIRTLDRGNDSTSDPGYGEADDPLVGTYVGGINVFGGGLALYGSGGVLLGGLGVSGDTSCADHVVAWITRDTLDLDSVPAGVSPTGDDNIIFDITGSHGNFQSKSGFGHPTCGFGEEATAKNLPTNYPIE